MTPVEAARRIVADMPTRGGSGGRCYYCLGAGQQALPHDDDCPIPSMPGIVAALEAAERHLVRGDQATWFDAAIAFGLVEVVDTEQGRLYRAPVAPGLVMESTSPEALRGR